MKPTYQLWSNVGSAVGGGGVHYTFALVPEGEEPPVPNEKIIAVGNFRQHLDGFSTAEGDDGDTYITRDGKTWMRVNGGRVPARRGDTGGRT